jgi:membrane protease YdiL (CAAX protease family)
MSAGRCGVSAVPCGARADANEGLASDAAHVNRTRSSRHEQLGTAPGNEATGTLDPTIRLARSRPLATFVILAFAVSWSWMLPLVASGDVVEKGIGWPTHLPALLGPALAAFLVTALSWGRVGVRDLVGRVGLWRMPMRWWAAALSPLSFLGLALAVAFASGTLPDWSDFGRFSGLPTIGVVPVAVIVVLAALGEETGWRGFALPVLQRRYGALAAALLVTPIWAAWHVPFFFTVATYRDFAPVGYVGFVFGLACGSIVLTWLYNGTGGSILACAVWHGVYNLASGTAAADGTIAAITSTFVMVQALLLVGLELRARRRGTAPILGPRRTRDPYLP